MNTNEKIDKAYEKLLSTADSVSSNGITEEFAKNMSEIHEEVANINNAISDQDVDEEVMATEVPENVENTSEKVMTSYNPVSGNIVVGKPDDELSAKEYAEKNLRNFMSDEKDADNIKESIKSSKLLDLSDNDAEKISKLIVKRMSGETTGFYDGLPESMKASVTQIAINSNTNNIKQSNIKNKNFIARSIVDELIKEMKNTPDNGFDLDTMLSGFDKDAEKLENEMSTELGSMMMGFDDDRKAAIDAAIKRCEEAGKTDAVEKLTHMKDTIDESFTLNKFKEFCKTCKIKRYDTVKPTRLFNIFNSKYENHKYVINDIQSCPNILDRHLTKNTHVQNLMICLAFAKFTIDMTPDNIEEHSFMYYFIRNIISIDHLNPKGRLYESMDEKSKTFYDEFVKNLYECSAALSEKNPTLL